jgi:hypothetical protein
MVFTGILLSFSICIISLGIFGKIYEKGISETVLFLSLGSLLLILGIVNFIFCEWYKGFHEIPFSEFTSYKFANIYILVHKTSNIAYVLPLEALDILDLRTIKIRSSYNYKKKLIKEELNLLDQNRN